MSDQPATPRVTPEEACTARRSNGTYLDPESCGCERCEAWQQARDEAWELGPQLANPDY